MVQASLLTSATMVGKIIDSKKRVRYSIAIPVRYQQEFPH